MCVRGPGPLCVHGRQRLRGIELRARGQRATECNLGHAAAVRRQRLDAADTGHGPGRRFGSGRGRLPGGPGPGGEHTVVVVRLPGAAVQRGCGMLLGNPGFESCALSVLFCHVHAFAGGSGQVGAGAGRAQQVWRGWLFRHFAASSVPSRRAGGPLSAA